MLGHEISHAIAHHSAENIGDLSFFILLNDLLAGFFQSAEAVGLGLIGELAVGGLLKFLLPLTHSHKLGSEADAIGLRLAAAGYDPTEAARVWRRTVACAAVSSIGGALAPAAAESSHARVC